MANKQLLLYVPVVHRGIEELVRRHLDVTEILLLGKSFTDQFPWMKKDVRAIEPHAALQDMTWRFRSINFRVVESIDLHTRVFADVLVLPDEELSHKLIERYGLDDGNRSIIYDTTWLRWDRKNALAQEKVTPDEIVTSDQMAIRVLNHAADASKLSSDWWRQVGAVISDGDREIITAVNRHMPTEYTPYIDGDPRGSFRRGEHIELTTAIHAEAACIGWCARHGYALEGTSIFVTTFPCPVCARLIVASGIAYCYYAGGYAVLDGVKILRDANVRLIRVKI